jgi:probable addiction module antidote protein
MNKKRTSRKREFSLADIPRFEIPDSVHLTEFDTTKFFQNRDTIGKALLECLIDNEPKHFMEILESFVRVNKRCIAREAAISRATVHNAFSKRGNPTLKTIAKIVHQATQVPKIAKSSKTTTKIFNQAIKKPLEHNIHREAVYHQQEARR